MTYLSITKTYTCIEHDIDSFYNLTFVSHGMIQEMRLLISQIMTQVTFHNLGFYILIYLLSWNDTRNQVTCFASNDTIHFS